MKTMLYFIAAQTGCTCCSGDNYIEGPYRTQKQAEDRALHLHGCKSLASQYAENGIYTLFEKECEVLSEGRIICDNLLLEADMDGEWYIAPNLPYIKDMYDLSDTKAIVTIR